MSGGSDTSRDGPEATDSAPAVGEQEAQYRSIFDATTDAMIIYDQAGHVVEANLAACQMLGYPYADLLGRHVGDLAHPDDADELVASFQTIQQGGTSPSRGIVRRRNGALIYGEGRATPFRYRGRPHVLMVTRDITAQVEAEAQLRDTEAQYRGIFDATTDGLIISDLDGVVVEANPAACRMHGYAYEEFIGLDHSAFVHPASAHLYADYVRTLETGQTFQVRALDVRKDGAPLNVEVHGTTFIYKGRLHRLAVIRDLSERVRAEEQLREAQEQYRRIFEASSDGLIINDPTRGVVVEANPAVCRMHGYRYDEFIGLHATAFIHPDDHPVFADFVRTIMAGGTYQCQSRDVRKDGSSFPVEVHGSSVLYRGRPHILAVVRDITERVEAYELLERRVADRTRELTTLLDVSHQVASTLEVRPLLGRILDHLPSVVAYSGAAILTVEGDALGVVDYRGPLARARVVGLRVPLLPGQPEHRVIHAGAPVILDDVGGETALIRAVRAAWPEEGHGDVSYIRSWVGLPLLLNDRAIGMMALAHRDPGHYTPRHAHLAMAIATQAALAIDNARHYEQAQELAALEERQRLARELHDSVSQALYGVALGARTARTLIESDPTRAVEPLDYVLGLAEAGLAEMRSLIFELRPEALETDGLVAALEKQAAALQARHGISVTSTQGSEPEVPFATKEALYRIAQEALHNTAKHAGAAVVRVSLAREGRELVLRVEDDGRGFDAAAAYPGHLGLRSMQERAERAGGVLSVESTPGRGTVVRVALPLPHTE